MKPHYGPKKLLDVVNIYHAQEKIRSAHLCVSTTHGVPPARTRLNLFISLDWESCSLTVSARDVVISNIDQFKFQEERKKREWPASRLRASISGPQSFIVGKYCSSIIEINEDCQIHAVCRPCALVRKKRNQNRILLHSKHTSTTVNTSATRDAL